MDGKETDKSHETNRSNAMLSILDQYADSEASEEQDNLEKKLADFFEEVDSIAAQSQLPELGPLENNEFNNAEVLSDHGEQEEGFEENENPMQTLSTGDQAWEQGGSENDESQTESESDEESSVSETQEYLTEWPVKNDELEALVAPLDTRQEVHTARQVSSTTAVSEDTNNLNVDEFVDDELERCLITTPESVVRSSMLSVEEIGDRCLLKLRCLDPGETSIPIQAFIWQLTARLEDYKQGALLPDYALKKALEVDAAIAEVERSIAPAGWQMSWDDLSKDYRYINLSTGEVRTQYFTVEDEDDAVQCPKRFKPGE